jgi:hypothetical protein
MHCPAWVFWLIFVLSIARKTLTYFPHKTLTPLTSLAKDLHHNFPRQKTRTTKSSFLCKHFPLHSLHDNESYIFYHLQFFTTYNLHPSFYNFSESPKLQSHAINKQTFSDHPPDYFLIVYILFFRSYCTKIQQL